MDIEILKNMIELEKQASSNSNKLENKLPDYYFFEIAVLLLHHASDEISNHEILRTLIEDLFELRKAKLNKTMKLSSMSHERVKKLDNISFFEVNMLRGEFYQKGYQISHTLWDLISKSQEKLTKEAGKEQVEEVYDEDF